MPILPENRHRYPGGSTNSPEWLTIRKLILDRAGWRCEGSPAYPDCRRRYSGVLPGSGGYVVLTVAHLDHQPEHNDPSNLRAWCQRCHNTYDVEHRRQTRLMRRRRLITHEQGSLFESGPMEAIL